MSHSLKRLALYGDIEWSSYYFAEFVCNTAGLEADSTLGYSAALVSQAALDGNVCVELSAFAGKPLFASSLEAANEPLLGPATEAWHAALESCDCVGQAGDYQPLILDDNRLYLQRFWHYENCVAQRIRSMLVDREAPISDIEQRLNQLMGSESAMDAAQTAATVAAASRQFVVISGGPGSGKTSTVIRILALLMSRDPEYRVALAAPTGKAAARMMESIRQRLDQLPIDADLKAALPVEAQTLHRLLRYRHGSFVYREEHRLPVDCVIVDEASMIDLKLMYQLLSALPDSARLILLGDRDQLASVAAGNVLADITGQGARHDTSVRELAQATRLLGSNYRFGSDSAIGALARQVNRGDASAAIDGLRDGEPELCWYDSAGEAINRDAFKWLLDRYQGIFESETPAEALDIYEKTRLLCATNRGPIGIDAMNAGISEALLARNGLAVAERFSGLPIMITRNARELSLFNGDTGILWSIDGELRACFRELDGSLRDLSINRLPVFKPAWAVTVHKSQGSEFDAVLLLLPGDSSNELLSRELLYTAITRARRSFSLQASRQVIQQMIGRLTQRHSGLATKLGWRQSLD